MSPVYIVLLNILTADIVSPSCISESATFQFCIGWHNIVNAFVCTNNACRSLIWCLWSVWAIQQPTLSHWTPTFYSWRPWTDFPHISAFEQIATCWSPLSYSFLFPQQRRVFFKFCCFESWQLLAVQPIVSLIYLEPFCLCHMSVVTQTLSIIKCHHKCKVGT